LKTTPVFIFNTKEKAGWYGSIRSQQLTASLYQTGNSITATRLRCSSIRLGIVQFRTIRHCVIPASALVLTRRDDERYTRTSRLSHVPNGVAICCWRKVHVYTVNSRLLVCGLSVHDF
jgi:hypothetical protein